MASMRIQSLRDIHLSFPDMDGFWNLQNLPETEERISALLPLGDGKATATQVEALTQMARVYLLQDNLKEARNFLNHADTLLKDLPAEEMLKPQVRIYLEEGRFYGWSMYPQRALDFFSKAWEMSNLVGPLDALAADAAFMISITLPSKQGREWLTGALKLADNPQATTAAKKWKAHLLMRIGWQEFDVRNFQAALDHFDKALVCADKDDSTLFQTLKWCRARVLRAIGKINEAMAVQNEILTDLATEGVLNGHVYLELAECFNALHDQEQSSHYYELAHEKLKLSKWYSENFSSELSEILKKSKKKKYR